MTPPTVVYPKINERASFDVEALGDLLDAPYGELLRGLRETLASPEFAWPKKPLPTSEFRELTLEWTRGLARRGYGGLFFPAEYGGGGDRAQSLTLSEVIPQHDGSLNVKFGVQFGLWGGSVFQLGTAYHHRKYLPDTIRLALPGCFAMTEIGHGSNVRELETTATYDTATQSFIIHTPHPGAGKCYIGNAATHGRIATVFAQLIVDDTRHGVHPFVVPLRDPDGRLLPGVITEDNGEKVGLNGVDNGRIWFDQVRIPREEMLDRFAQVAPDGTYTSSIADPTTRFFTMVGTLVGARIAVASGGLATTKVGLAIATRYAARRRQFGPANQPERLLIDYPAHQRWLFPRIARAYALHFSIRAAVALYDTAAKAKGDMREVETLAAGLKAWSTDNNIETLQIAREACGGEGYLAINRFGALKADSDIGATFDGANPVLYQLIAKTLLGQLRAQLQQPDGKKRIAREQLAAWKTWRSPWARRRGAYELLSSPTWQSGLLAARARLALLELAEGIQAATSRGLSVYDAFIACQSTALVAAEAAVERDLVVEFDLAIAGATDVAVRMVLKKLCCLFGFDLIQRRLGWLSTREFIGGKQAIILEGFYAQALTDLRPDAVALVDAWRIPAVLRGAPIAAD